MASGDTVTVLTGGFESSCGEVATNTVTIICERDGEEVVCQNCDDLASVHSIRAQMKQAGFDTTELDDRLGDIEKVLG